MFSRVAWVGRSGVGHSSLSVFGTLSFALPPARVSPSDNAPRMRDRHFTSITAE